MTNSGAHNSAPYAYYETKTPAIERSQFEKGAPIFSGSPALIPDLIFPVEAGIGGGPTEPQQHLIFQTTTNRNRQFSSFRQTLQLVAKKNSQWFALCCNSKFRSRHADTCRCTSVVLFLESDVAVVGLITVRTAQIWGRKIASEIIALNARSQDFGGDWRWNHPLILNS